MVEGWKPRGCSAHSQGVRSGGGSEGRQEEEGGARPKRSHLPSPGPPPLPTSPITPVIHDKLSVPASSPPLPTPVPWSWSCTPALGIQTVSGSLHPH